MEYPLRPRKPNAPRHLLLVFQVGLMPDDVFLHLDKTPFLLGA
jgi:hypothetical protein